MRRDGWRGGLERYGGVAVGQAEGREGEGLRAKRGEAEWREGNGEAGGRGRVATFHLFFCAVRLLLTTGEGTDPDRLGQDHTARGKQTLTKQRLAFHLFINAGLHGGDVELPSARKKTQHYKTPARA